MTYYDHATAMAFKLDRWSEERILRNYELEVLVCQQRMSDSFTQKQSPLVRLLCTFRNRKAADKSDKSISRTDDK